MKRLHVHIKVKDLNASTQFYAAMFGREPDKLESDYAKWMLDDPVANVSLSAHGGSPGIDHVGVQLDTESDLDDIAERLERAGAPLMREADTSCCYAQSHKYWTRDPQDAVWELFHTFGENVTYGAEPDRSALSESEEISAVDACCRPEQPQ